MATTWDLFRDMDALRREIDGVLHSMGNGRQLPARFPFSFLPGRAARAYPLVNVSEDAQNVYIEALAPGVEPDSLELRTVHNQLTISGEKQANKPDVAVESYHRSERSAGRFVRTVELPVDVEDEKATAEYKNGILLVTIPKGEKARPRQIDVKVK